MNTKVTRRQVLEKAKEIYISKFESIGTGLCFAIDSALLSYGFEDSSSYEYLKVIFPLFTLENARNFGANRPYPGGYWWYRHEFDGRISFLDWLIEQYKHDDSDVIEIYMSDKCAFL